MKNLEVYRALKRKISEYDFKKLNAELKAKKENQNILEDEALKAEILEEKNWKTKREVAKENRREIEEIEKKIKGLERSVQLFREKQEEVSRSAKKEVEKEYRPTYEAKVRELLKKAKETEKVEQELEQITKEANVLCEELDTYVGPHSSVLDSIILPPLHLIAYGGYGQRGEKCESPLEKFIKDCKEAGIKIE